jgi:uncharacterized protein (TIGR00299 family) protein
MARVLYLDCQSGASGDMVLGALLDLGVSIDALREALAGIVPPQCRLVSERVTRSGIAATAFRVEEPHVHHHGGHAAHRGLPAILEMIAGSALPARVKSRAAELFERLGRIEAEIHQVAIEKVHFHEVGALDSIVDIVGTVWALESLGLDRIVASPLNTGSGSVATEHGRLPVPAPATLRLLEGAPVYSSGTPMELVTPTGALLVVGHASAFGPMPAMVVRRSGYGAGTREIAGHPNVLRAILGDDAPAATAADVQIVECNIDDMNPQIYGVVMERLAAAGALDVYLTPVQMKKNRPGTLLTVVVPPQSRDGVCDVLFRETTTIGVRYYGAARECLAREWDTVATQYGPVRVKIARRSGEIANAAPEFDDCVARAGEHQVAVKDVQAAAMQTWLSTRASRHD